MFVYGDSFQAFLVAIIVPNPDFAKEWAAGKGIQETDPKKICQNGDFMKEIMDQMAKKEKESKLNGMEKVKRVHFHGEMFTVENDMLTPTFKVKRNIAKKVFEKEIEKMYSEGEPNRV